MSATLPRHDGQMGIEDVETTGATTLTRYGLGVRGVDLIERTTNGTATTAFPVYDAHGNNVATLSRSGSGGYALADRRTYDAWGVVRSQQSGGDPKLRYCVSLGHKQDDESGLVYMRARYYEPTSGRFVSQDPGLQGWNWFIYADNRPTVEADLDGRGKYFDTSGAAWGFLVGFVAAVCANGEFSVNDLRAGIVGALVMCFRPTNELGAAKMRELYSLVKSIVGPSLAALQSPENQAAVDSEAGPAVVELEAEEGAVAAELVEDAAYEEGFTDGGGI